MQAINYLSQIMLPFIFIIIILWGFFSKIDMFSVFTEGAVQGLKTVIGVFPSLAGLMCAVAVFRASGAMDMLVSFISILLIYHFSKFH